jgi:hypothetical protein
MKKYTGFSARASLAVVGLWMQEQDLWAKIEDQVQIEQKTIRHRPLDKVKDAFINILAGGHGITEVNTLVRTDPVLQQAFGRRGCAEQSTVSETLNACTEKTVAQMAQALKQIYQSWGQGYRHDYEQAVQVLDVDMTGLVCGPQAEGATKGYFPGRKNRRGRQLGRVLATCYAEVVCEKLYPGALQLEKSFPELVEKAETVLALDEPRRQRTILRIDGGGGTDADINWAVRRGYGLIGKVKNWQRTRKLAQTVETWSAIPKLPAHEVGWVGTPFPYEKPMRQLALRWPKPKGGWHYRILVFNLTDELLFKLAGRALPATPTQPEVFAAIVDAYDLRGGGVETSIKNSKQGLGLNKRNKKSFAAQEMLILLAQLAYNLSLWVRNQLAQHQPALAGWGMLRMTRDLFQIPGKIQFDPQGKALKIILSQRHTLAGIFYQTRSSLSGGNGLRLILGKI